MQIQNQMFIAILTTKGPVLVRGFEPESSAAHSVITTFDARHREVGVSSLYRRFPATMGSILAKEFGVTGKTGPFVLEVDGKIDIGRSWELGATLVQFLYVVDRLAIDPKKDGRLVVVSGQIGTTTLRIEEVESIPEKIELARHLITDWLNRGHQVTLLLPAMADIGDRRLPEGTELVLADHLREALAALGLIASPPAPNPASLPSHSRLLPWWIISAGMAAAFTAGIVAAPLVPDNLRYLMQQRWPPMKPDHGHVPSSGPSKANESRTEVANRDEPRAVTESPTSEPTTASAGPDKPLLTSPGQSLPDDGRQAATARANKPPTASSPTSGLVMAPVSPDKLSQFPIPEDEYAQGKRMARSGKFDDLLEAEKHLAYAAQHNIPGASILLGQVKLKLGTGAVGISREKTIEYLRDSCNLGNNFGCEKLKALMPNIR